jgi:TDG/mug DNA glycosylase family protein
MRPKPCVLKSNRSNVVWKPTREQIADAAGKTVRDVIAPDLRVLFCGINPGLYTAAVGHHFARPGNRFWKALYEGGFTERLLSPFDELDLLKRGFGVTNVVGRATGVAHRERRSIALIALGVGYAKVVRPSIWSTVPLTTPKARWTATERIATILPNPSGLNANYQQTDPLVSLAN